MLREALANTIAHDSLEDSRKCLYVACRCTAGGAVSITVEDEGQDFATELVADPSTPGNSRPWAEKKKARQRKFFTPAIHSGDAVAAQAYLLSKFDLHKCEEPPKKHPDPAW